MTTWTEVPGFRRCFLFGRCFLSLSPPPSCCMGTRSGSSKKSKRGGRSPEKTAARLRAHLASGEQSRLQRAVHITPKQYPHELLHHVMSQDEVRATVAQLCPLPISELTLVNLDGQKLLQINVPADVLQALANDSIPHPPFLFKMFDSVGSAITAEILRLHDIYEATGPRRKQGEEQRSSIPATHVGAWEMYRKRRKGPNITTESRDPQVETRAALDAFLAYLNTTLFKRVNDILKNDHPDLWERGLRAQRRLDRFLWKQYAERPALRFGPAFACIAFKYGTSEIIHLDFSDDWRYLTWCLPVGEHWEGAFFVIPQLKIRIPIRPGKMYAVLAGVVAHCSTPTTGGKRLILTGFMQKDLLKRADAAFFKKDFVETDVAALYDE
ncbi:hypothetical protein C8J56DRAFT_1045058 [Mycena floridula]|nr:hypothetical protein C8J56DRAFT_1045058 [Mycena floridula]